MAILGISLEFAPHEILNYFEVSSAGSITALFVQLTGALYLGFAMMNWMAKAVLIGGIYARPLAVGNFSHFLIRRAGFAQIRLCRSEFMDCLGAGGNLFAAGDFIRHRLFYSSAQEK